MSGGFDNGVCYATNIDLRGTVPVVGQFTADGQMLIGATVAPFARIGIITAGMNVVVTPSAGGLMISVPGGAPLGFTWTEVTSVSNPVNLTASNGYIAKGAGVVDFVLPAVAVVGDTFYINGYGNLWTLEQGVGQTIFIGNGSSTAGAGVKVTATDISDVIQLVCVTANTEFKVLNVQGNPTVS